MFGQIAYEELQFARTMYFVITPFAITKKTAEGCYLRLLSNW